MKRKRVVNKVQRAASPPLELLRKQSSVDAQLQRTCDIVFMHADVLVKEKGAPLQFSETLHTEEMY